MEREEEGDAESSGLDEGRIDEVGDEPVEHEPDAAAPQLDQHGINAGLADDDARHDHAEAGVADLHYHGDGNVGRDSRRARQQG